jgi:hypothetical protein
MSPITAEDEPPANLTRIHVFCSRGILSVVRSSMGQRDGGEAEL